MIGRKDEILRVARILSQKRKANPVLVGEPGVGKTGIVEGLAQRIASSQCPEFLRDARIVEISMSALIAGTKHRGEFEERLQAVMAACPPRHLEGFLQWDYGLIFNPAALASLRWRTSKERKVFAPDSRASATCKRSMVRWPSVAACFSLNSSARRKTSVQATGV